MTNLLAAAFHNGHHVVLMIAVAASLIVCAGVVMHSHVQSPNVDGLVGAAARQRELQRAPCSDVLSDGQNYRIVPRHDVSMALSIEDDSIVIAKKGSTGKQQIWNARKYDNLGTFYQFVNIGDGRAINVSGMSFADGADIIPWPLIISTPSISNRNDAWCLQDAFAVNSENFYLIAGHNLVTGQDKVMDVFRGRTSSGTNVLQYQRSDKRYYSIMERGSTFAENQQFRFEVVTDAELLSSSTSCNVCAFPDEVQSLQDTIKDMQGRLEALEGAH